MPPFKETPLKDIMPLDLAEAAFKAKQASQAQRANANSVEIRPAAVPPKGEFPATWGTTTHEPYSLEYLNELASRDRYNGVPGTYITAHRVFGFGPEHTAIEHIAEDGSRKWISGGPGQSTGTLTVDSGNVPALGYPVEGKRSSDAPYANYTVGRVIAPRGVSDSDYFRMLDDEQARYPDSANYNTFPGVMGGANSNSVAPTLLERTGGFSTVDFGDYVGGSHRISDYQFNYGQNPPTIWERAWGRLTHGGADILPQY